MIVEAVIDKTDVPHNQLRVLLTDKMEIKHSEKLLNPHTYYAELLNDRILSQHTQKKYLLEKNGDFEFKIIDNCQISEEIPF